MHTGMLTHLPPRRQCLVPSMRIFTDSEILTWMVPDTDFIVCGTHWMVPSVLNVRNPHFPLCHLLCPESCLLGNDPVWSNPPTSSSPISTIGLRALYNWQPFSKTFPFCWYVLPCVFACCEGTIVSVFTASGGLQISFSDRLKITSCSSGFRLVLVQKYVFTKLKFQITSFTSWNK